MSGRGSLRLSGGAFRGRNLKVGRDLRPTEGRVREALFSIWSEDLVDAHFLDLFAGTGAISLEAEGRGAEEVVAIDQNTDLLEGNLATVGSRAVQVHQGDVVAVLKRLRAEAIPPSFDLIFADPPYGYRAYESLLASAAPLLDVAGELALEHSARRPMPAEISRPSNSSAQNFSADPPEAKFTRLLRVDERRYGETTLSFYRPAGR